MKVYREQHKKTLTSLLNLGAIYRVGLKNYEKALES